MRFDKNFSDATRLIVATEGILTARLQQDPLVQDLRTIIIDEFHERSIHADLGIVLAREAWRARDDLRLIVMSATIAAEPVSAYLGGCPVIDVPGRLHPIEIDYAPGVTVEQVIARVFPKTRGAVLCFLAGAGEIRRAAEALTAVRISCPAAGVVFQPAVGGSMPATVQCGAFCLQRSHFLPVDPCRLH